MTMERLSRSRARLIILKADAGFIAFSSFFNPSSTFFSPAVVNQFFYLISMRSGLVPIRCLIIPKARQIKPQL